MRRSAGAGTIILSVALAVLAGCSGSAPPPTATSGPAQPSTADGGAATPDGGAPVTTSAAPDQTSASSPGSASSTSDSAVVSAGTPMDAGAPVSASGAAASAPSASAAATNAGAGTCWDWLPTIGYDSEALVIALRVGGDPSLWHAHRIYKDGWGGELPLTVANGAVTLNVYPGATPDADTIEFSGPRAGDDVRVRLVRPGSGRGLGHDNLGHLTMVTADGSVMPAILVLTRLEAEADRRWQTLRWLGGEPTFQCTLTLAAPVVPSGQSDLLALIAASQSSDPAGHNVLVQLGAADRLVGWNHRNYRQCLAWLVADLTARSAGHLVIAGPLAPSADADRVAPLRGQVDDVAAAYRCQVVQLGELADASYWQVAPGIIGPQLNASGQAEVQRRLAPWLSPH
jgi:hypothetical protein